MSANTVKNEVSKAVGQVAEAINVEVAKTLKPEALRAAIAELTALLPKPEPVVTGKTLDLLVAQKVDLTIPIQRDRWFASLPSGAKVESKFIIDMETEEPSGSRLLLNGQEVGRLMSDDLMEVIFFNSIAKSFLVWKEKGEKNPQADNSAHLGRLPGKQIKELFEAGISTSVIASRIGREEKVVAQYLAGQGLLS